ncbi:hypothetical protein J2W32_004488 [Variovorax boronicumulans]|uniref:DUF4145 domain-containing protein n=1 Tax=Variovorax boronicumulans TaxID=436515 RepID=A0AAW8CYG4_9BURK|nr:DUF4145 domain-containing protein [Variovorax boronicumulans]MDP9895390.1 hypothetical protein [Variovorax boronicumulans]MDQ0055430.1 hypothetical protein [Variovorax boronicumulans]
MSTTDNAPAISKRSFTCPHCGAFAGQHWFHVHIREVHSNGGIPPSQGDLVRVAHTSNSDQVYIAYATKMLHARLSFMAPEPLAAGRTYELFNSAVSRCGSCDKIALWVGDKLVFPESPLRPAAPLEVPEALRADYDEAAKVLPHSAKASAALSRRCLQTLLRDKGYKQHNLGNAIQALLDANTLPSGLAEIVDAIRNVGNFAAHAMKDTNTGAILDVEPAEAEWNLEVLEGLFDHFYVGPAKNAKRLQALNTKLNQGGKPAVKS